MTRRIENNDRNQRRKMGDDVEAIVPAGAVAPAGVEVRSIDFVPLKDRRGRARDLGAVWSVSNINLTAMATGVTALSLGGTLFWTLIATLIGALFGTFFMAFHSAQGPHLGLPQLVQSRAQFGYIGAALTVWIFALINYVNYNVADAILSGSSVKELTGVPTAIGFPLAALVAGTLAIYGYHWIHKVANFLAVPLIAMTLILTLGALTNHALPAGAFAPGDLRFAPFMTTFVMVAGFQIGWSPYVSDYSRYLRPDIGTRTTFWWTYLPSAFSALWIIALGAILSAAAPGAGVIQAFRAGGDSLIDGLGWIIVFLLLIGLLAVMALNAYGGSLTLISIVDSIRPVVPTRRLRIFAVALMSVSVWLIATAVGEDDFNVFYGNILVFLAYLFAPWTAINLVDYYFVRRGLYSIREIFNPRGIYGRWGWQGNTAYFVAFAAMIPFFVTAPFTGPIASRLHNVDYAIFVGLIIASVLYYILAKKTLDLDNERRIIEAEGLIKERI